jgi:NADH-quinone oxidoreductase subunit I
MVPGSHGDPITRPSSLGKIISFKRGLWEQLYLPEIVRGLGITLRHFFVNTFGSKEIVTIRYPEEKRTYPPRFRGVHRLMLREDGTVRCVACMMCSTICPAQCITIVAGEREDGSSVEKYPASFEIDELICVVCGLCVEACPCDALRMDSGIHFPPVEHRYETLMTKEDLMRLGGQNIARQGGAGPDWRETYELLGDDRQIYDREGALSEIIKGS